jgi:hypothetical protein
MIPLLVLIIIEPSSDYFVLAFEELVCVYFFVVCNMA